MLLVSLWTFYGNNVLFKNVLLICLTESGTKGTVRFKIFGENLQTFNYIVPGGPVAEQEHWRLFARGARDHFLIITDGLLLFSAKT